VGQLAPGLEEQLTALSKLDESLPPGVMMGFSFLMSSPNNGDFRTDCRARIQFTLPFQWCLIRRCALRTGKDAPAASWEKVFVEKR